MPGVDTASLFKSYPGDSNVQPEVRIIVSESHNKTADGMEWEKLVENEVGKVAGWTMVKI